MSPDLVYWSGRSNGGGTSDEGAPAQSVGGAGAARPGPGGVPRRIGPGYADLSGGVEPVAGGGDGDTPPGSGMGCPCGGGVAPVGEGALSRDRRRRGINTARHQSVVALALVLLPNVVLIGVGVLMRGEAQQVAQAQAVGGFGWRRFLRQVGLYAFLALPAGVWLARRRAGWWACGWGRRRLGRGALVGVTLGPGRSCCERALSRRTVWARRPRGGRWRRIWSSLRPRRRSTGDTYRPDWRPGWSSPT